jgi:hypothetical protein
MTSRKSKESIPTKAIGSVSAVPIKEGQTDIYDAITRRTRLDIAIDQLVVVGFYSETSHRPEDIQRWSDAGKFWQEQIKAFL